MNHLQHKGKVVVGQMSLEDLFSTAELSLYTPDTSLQFPPDNPADGWLKTLLSSPHERNQAFFDEQLHSLVTLRVKHPTPDTLPDTRNPPSILVKFLAHVQISLEASYISPTPTASGADGPVTARLSAPPRVSSLKPTPRTGPYHPSILPPHTPNPTPATTDQDKKYVMSQGSPLSTITWGQNTAEDSEEAFALLWSEQEQVWVAIYRVAFTVSFLRLSFSDPLLCLTAFATLREKPVTNSPSNNPLTRFMKSLDEGNENPAPDSPRADHDSSAEDQVEKMDGLEEVNLLEGLLAGPTFSRMGSSEINLPSTRLGLVSRQKLFSLPPINLPTPTAPSASPMTAARKAPATLRRSFRKTLQTVSGFRVRMRTVFVPNVVLAQSNAEQDMMESGNGERSVVLCVELENSAESRQNIGFEVEKVDVNISGDEAKATLISWGDLFSGKESAVFPLKIARWAQYNLLYAVTFLRTPEELNAFSFARRTDNNPYTDLQRAVSITIHGKPYLQSQDTTVYPTHTFSSKWNCVLDLTTHQHQVLRPLDSSDPTSANPNVLPEPPSPFPVLGLQTPRQYSPPGTATPLDSARAQLVAGQLVKPLTSRPRPTSTPITAPTGRFSQLVSPSQYQYLRSSTTYAAPLMASPAPEVIQERPYPNLPSSVLQTHNFDTPVTPAYPAFPPKSGLPPTPMSQGPVIHQASVGMVGPHIEARRRPSSFQDSPASAVSPMIDPNAHKHLPRSATTPDTGEAIIVSVGLLSNIRTGGISRIQDDMDHASELGPGKIYPLDIFTLDIFVFNRSERTRRFEIHCPEKRRRRRGGEDSGIVEGTAGTDSTLVKKMGYPGVLPMEGRVRIGPLLPSACQSVRMEFLAVSPGVHSIDALTLTDIESGYSMNLRSVMDIVVHKPDD